jgi:hypothetical protein
MPRWAMCRPRERRPRRDRAGITGAPSALDVYFTPISASWLNAVEGFAIILTKRRLQRGVFRAVADLQAVMNRFIDHHNARFGPFNWVADSDKIISAVRREHQMLDSSTTCNRGRRPKIRGHRAIMGNLDVGSRRRVVGIHARRHTAPHKYYSSLNLSVSTATAFLLWEPRLSRIHDVAWLQCRREDPFGNPAPIRRKRRTL